jgi:hypothetical protein
MLVGATVFCFLVLLVLLADRLSTRVWHGGADTTLYLCEECDLRYPRRELHDPTMQTCPAGHAIALVEHGTAAGLVGIYACLGFLSVALLLILTGILR